MRTGGDAGGSSMGGGRLTPRPDTLRPGTRAGSGPAPQSQIFVGRLVIISSGGANTGLFVYNGTPALGNPPIAAIVAPGVTHDPYGNPVNAVANFGNISAGHFGIDLNGFTYLSNSAGKNVIIEQTTNGSMLFYNSSGQGLGNLVVAISPVSGTDPPGNTYPAGLSSNANINVFGAANAVQFVALQPSTITTETWHTPALNANFAAGGVTPQYQFEGTNGGRVRLRGSVNVTGAVAASTTMFTLPAHYQPTFQSFWATPTSSAGFVLGGSSVNVLTTGDVQIVPATGAGKSVLLDGIVFPID